jgi:hypothetical protein
LQRLLTIVINPSHLLVEAAALEFVQQAMHRPDVGGESGHAWGADRQRDGHLFELSETLRASYPAARDGDGFLAAIEAANFRRKSRERARDLIGVQQVAVLHMPGEICNAFPRIRVRPLRQ